MIEKKFPPLSPHHTQVTKQQPHRPSQRRAAELCADSPRGPISPGVHGDDDGQVLRRLPQAGARGQAGEDAQGQVAAAAQGVHRADVDRRGQVDRDRDARHLHGQAARHARPRAREQRGPARARLRGEQALLRQVWDPLGEGSHRRGGAAWKHNNESGTAPATRAAATPHEHSSAPPARRHTRRR